MRLLTLLLSFFFIFSACSQTTDSDPDNGEDNGNGDVIEGTVVDAFPNLDFIRPLNIQHAGDGTNRLFVVEQAGTISVFSNDPDITDREIFLDIEGRVTDISNEQGLLGLAFHPDFETNGYFYVNYTAPAPDRTVISRFSVSDDDQNRANPASETVLLTYNQPYGNHNGGHIAFGPDGYLYIAAGDGGSAGDPENNGQDRSTLLGSILRIDVDSQDNGNEYGIPDDNPFAGNEQGYREEIFAYGLRNPWRFSFDAETEKLWAGDVGQNTMEEIDIIESGLNYGWNIMEGTMCYPPGTECDTEDLELPVYAYNHSEGDRSVTGGYVYRGSDIPGLTGYYIYADFVSGRIWALDTSDLENPDNTELFDADFRISSFGVDQENEIYITGFDGNIYRFGEDIVDEL
ncbi:PQQ-dependent sugar dehydrogenase [Rhodohalobacter sp. 8-1]|uniref:PQQ-dependent sugar dehydrogenase n=1 Tax=Rhodohalobacter sp. 8-1 TaxID=3131972 RepID=UPI0030EC1153